MSIYEREKSWIRMCLVKDEKEEGGYRCFEEEILTFDELKDAIEFINDKWNWELRKPYWEMLDVYYDDFKKNKKVFDFEKNLVC